MERNQFERIEQMERHFNAISSSFRNLSTAFEHFEAQTDALQELKKYYGSKEWKNDFADSEAGLLPKDLYCGVLSEDGVWNLLEDIRELSDRMNKLSSL